MRCWRLNRGDPRCPKYAARKAAKKKRRRGYLSRSRAHRGQHRQAAGAAQPAANKSDLPPLIWGMAAEIERSHSPRMAN